MKVPILAYGPRLLDLVLPPSEDIDTTFDPSHKRFGSSAWKYHIVLGAPSHCYSQDQSLSATILSLIPLERSDWRTPPGMSFPHQSPYEDTKYDFNSGADWSLGSHHSSSPRILPQDGLRVEVTYEPHSPSMSFSNSPYLNSDQLPSSAPSTYPFMRKHDPWSNDLFHHGSASHSIQHGFDPELVKGMSGSAYLGPNSGISPAELGIETQFTNEPAFMDSALNSFSAGPTYSEPSPLMETTDYSPLPSRPHMNHYSSELTVNSAGSADMQRTESVWSNDSSYSRDCEDTTFRIDDISSATLDPSDIGELIDFPSKGPTSGRSYSTIKSGGIKKGRKRKLSAAERDSTAYMRKIGACYWCNKRKLKVGPEFFLSDMSNKKLVRRWNSLQTMCQVSCWGLAKISLSG